MAFALCAKLAAVPLPSWIRQSRRPARSAPASGAARSAGLADLHPRVGAAGRDPVVALTGLLSYAAYNPGWRATTRRPRRNGVLDFYLFSWPTQPGWLYRLNQGVHVTLGLVLVPVLLAKLWSVLPKLFTWPPVRSPAQALERLSLLLLVGGALFEFVTGILNVQYWYVFPFSFYHAHFYGAWVFIAASRCTSALKFGTCAVAAPAAAGDELREPGRTPSRAARARAGWSPPTPRRRACPAAALLGRSAPARCTLLAGRRAVDRRSAAAHRASSPPAGRTAAPGRTASRSTRPPPRSAITPARSARGGGCSCAGAGRRGSSAAPTCWPSPSTPPRCRSPASRAGRRPALDRRAAARPRPHGRRRAGAFMVLASLQERRRSTPRLRGKQVADGDAARAGRQRRRLSLDHGFPARVIVPANPGRALHQVGGPDDIRAGLDVVASGMMARFLRLYGASPLHLLGLLASLLIAGAGVVGWFDSFPGPDICGSSCGCSARPSTHDLILLPLYPLLDRIAFGATHGRRRARGSSRNDGWTYVRMPALLSGLLLLVFFPEAFRLGEATFRAASGSRRASTSPGCWPAAARCSRLRARLRDQPCAAARRRTRSRRARRSMIPARTVSGWPGRRAERGRAQSGIRGAPPAARAEGAASEPGEGRSGGRALAATAPGKGAGRRTRDRSSD